MDKQVEIYTTPTCAFCRATKEFLKEKGIAYTEYDVSQDATRRDEMIKISGQMGVPVIKIGEEMIIGFNKNKLSEVLGI